MNHSIINIKTDPKLKLQAQKTAKDLGFSLSSVINAYLINFVRTKTVNFSLLDESKPTNFFLQSLHQSKKDVESGNLSPSFTTAKDAVEWLSSEESKD